MNHEGAPQACPLCEVPAEPTAKFCSGCGAPLVQSSPTVARSKWYHNVWFVLCMLLFVLGPFGLPLVWKNPRFSRPVKALLSLLMLGYTALLIMAFTHMLEAVRASMDAFNSTLQF